MQDSVLFFIVLIIVFCGIFWYYNTNKNYNKVPKIIWTYLDDPDRIPKVAEMCMESWRKWNPDYEIILLTKKNYLDYLNIPYKITSNIHFDTKVDDGTARFIDLIRIHALHEHGGIWIDIGVFLGESVDKWLFPKPGEFSGFYLDRTPDSVSRLQKSDSKNGLLETFGKPTKTESENLGLLNPQTWFMACNKRSKFIDLWKTEYIKLTHYVTVEEYIKHYKDMNINIQNITDPIRNTLQIAVQKVLQQDKYPLETLILRDALQGPYKYLIDTKWDSEKGLELLCMDKKPPIVSLREAEVDTLEKNIDLFSRFSQCFL